ncbi:carotenoid biosynthesis protein [Kribbella sp. CA-293567]|uniref:carotenoid biosynthesis protein n=1 Tax=Kribbella sp. CA-293567 TaxID=3002436 RepID=UPI0022DE2C1C|nr:carotenoid biosynthesis protein [Kribbella sp. CA-293567]WBQ08323.1 carotenoid biosynthesis protein [Kribbella sp. CA-293567]
MTSSRVETSAARSWTAPRAVTWVAGGLAAAAVLVQMIFPFTAGGTFALTVASVLLLSAAALTHALATRGPSTALALLVVAGGGGLVAEAIGVSTGVPFGRYDYTGTLGWEVFGVPGLVPLAWVMMAWPALLVARLLVPGRRPVLRLLVAAWALTAWDVFLDPQMVDAGHWTWDDPHPALPGVEGIPLTNFAGWLVVSALICGVLDRLVPASAGRRVELRRDAVPVAVYLWTYGSSVLAHALFFGRPPVALVGSLVMGIVALPLAALVIRRTGRR